MFYVYEHIRPDTKAIFYVGKGMGRRAHKQEGRNAYWRNVVAKVGGFSVRMVAEDINEELAFLIEEERIDQLRLLGVKLCNMTDGGEGSSGCSPSEETRRKLSEASKGKVPSDEARRKMSEIHKGKVVSGETRRKLSEANKGHLHSEEARRKISEAKRNMSDELRRKIAEARKLRAPPNRITVQFDGMTFESITALARYIGKKPITIMWRVRNNPQKYGYVVCKA